MATDNSHWSRNEVEAIVADYFEMLASELSGVRYSKTAHRQNLADRLNGRSRPSIEFKHCNISAILVDAGVPYISGYKPRGNFQALLERVVSERLHADKLIDALAREDADRRIVVPEVDDILAIQRPKPSARQEPVRARGNDSPSVVRAPTNYLEREAHNRSLGLAGEHFVLQFEQARLIRAGFEALAAKIEHTSVVRGDRAGFDILSFETSGRERLIEVKTTQYGDRTPFFVTRNELELSSTRSDQYRLYRLYEFRRKPAMYELVGALNETCQLLPRTFMAMPA